MKIETSRGTQFFAPCTVTITFNELEEVDALFLALCSPEARALVRAAYGARAEGDVSTVRNALARLR